VDRGPSADNTTEAEKFREFWGSKSSLRRFQDGSIVDAVVWDGTKTAEKMIENILRYILGRHLPMFVGDDGEKIMAPCTNLDGLLPADIENGSSSPSADASASLSYLQAITELDKLRNVLASQVKGLPLIIDSVTGLSAQLRYTALFPPTANPLLLLPSKDVLRKYNGQAMSLFVRPMVIMAELEGSGKWPLTRAASEKLKSAYLLQLSDLLQSQFKVCLPLM
jgi:U3 small nucleolar RNA-associated protein 22